MLNIECNSLAEVYYQLSKIIDDSKYVIDSSPRGKRTKEIIAPTIKINNPRNRIAYHKDRKFSAKYALVESLMLFDDSNELKYFKHYNKNMEKFSDDGCTLFGSYGYRIAEHIPKLIDKLKNDNDTRQAVLPILKVSDSFRSTRDIPCTISLQLLIREGKLNMIVNMRSNDIFLGMPYDIFMFTMLQEVIANELNLELGWYIHRPGSLHLYEENFEIFNNVANSFTSISVTNRFNYDRWVVIKESYKRMVQGHEHNIQLGGAFNHVYKVMLLDKINKQRTA